MKRFLVAILLAGCATVPVSGDSPPGEPVEVVGHVISACGSDPLVREPVAARIAGELEVLDSTETDAEGAFSFRVVPKGDVTAALFVEARGVKTIAKSGKRGLVAELVLPCR